jgi:hypothetical protein
MPRDIRSVLNRDSGEDTGALDRLGRVITSRRKEKEPVVYLAAPYEPIEELDAVIHDEVIPLIEDMGIRVISSVGTVNTESIKEADLVVALVGRHFKNCEVGVQVGLAYLAEKQVLIFRYNFDMEEDWSLEPWLVYITDETDGAVVYNIQEFATAIQTFVDDYKDSELTSPTL